MRTLRIGTAKGAAGLLDSCTEQLLKILQVVRTEAVEEHMGYVALAAPRLEGLFSMAAVVWEDYPTLAPTQGPSIAPMVDDELIDGSYRLANSMTAVTAGRIVRMVDDLVALMDQAADVLRADCNPQQRTSMEAARRRAQEAVGALRRLASQHPDL